MFEQEKSAPWYKSTTIAIIAALVLPPVGLVLIWLNSAPVKRKIIASLAVVVIAIGYAYAFDYLSRMRGNEAQYDRVEAHRQEQAAHSSLRCGPFTGNAAERLSISRPSFLVSNTRRVIRRVRIIRRPANLDHVCPLKAGTMPETTVATS